MVKLEEEPTDVEGHIVRISKTHSFGKIESDELGNSIIFFKKDLRFLPENKSGDLEENVIFDVIKNPEDRDAEACAVNIRKRDSE